MKTSTPPALLLGLTLALAVLGIVGLLVGSSNGRPAGSATSSFAGTPTAIGSAGSSAGTPSGASTGGGSSSPATPGSSATTAPPPTSPTTSSFDPAQVALGLRLVAGGFDQPVFVTGAGDGSGRLYVVQQTGRIRIVRGGAILPTPFLDVSDLIACCGERGLLGLAFHPGYATDGRFYVYYTDNGSDHSLTIAEYRRSPADPDRADPSSGRVLLRIPHGQFPNHNGGMLAFGPDGMLYAGTGDGGGAGGEVGASQDLGSLLAKLIRIDVDHRSGDLAYAIPADNPFAGRSGARPEIWAYGLRNPWRFGFDRASGDLWIGDVGQDRWEEVDHAPRGVGGQNYGWNVMEGFHCYSPSSGCNPRGLTLPVAEYGHDQGCAIIGGYVYRGGGFPILRGGYLISDNCSGRIWALSAAITGRQTPVRIADTGRSISSFGQDDVGELYVTDLGAGQVLEVTASSR